MKVGSALIFGCLLSCSHFTGAAAVTQNQMAGTKVQAETVFNPSANELLVDFSGVQAELAGGPIEIMVLGTAHLNGMKDSLPPAHLSLLLNKLEKFAPDIIAIEGSSGISCGVLKEYEALYGETWENYCWDPSHVLKFLNVSPAQALRHSYQLLALPDEQITAQTRREMAAYFFAAGWSDSATLQWLQLAKTERVANNGVSTRLKTWLDKRILSANESVSIAAELGSRLGLRYLHPMDDHTADIVYYQAPKEMWQVISEVWKNGPKHKAAHREQEQALLGSAEGVLEYYRSINSQASQQLAIDADFGAVAKLTANKNTARRYLTWWQTRGLRMAANVIEATALNPSAKVLVIVGSSHKPYFDAYLNQMHDVKLVPVNSVLDQE